MTAPALPCSSKHGKFCSIAHADLVQTYRDERYRQEIENESTLENPGEKQIWKENGGKLINFQEWLIAHKGRNREDA